MEGSFISTSQPVMILLLKDIWQCLEVLFWLSQVEKCGEAVAICVKCEKARIVSKHLAMLRAAHSTKESSVLHCQ